MGSFIEPFPRIDRDRPLSNKELLSSLRLALSTEEEAVHLYDSLASAAKDHYVQEVLLSIEREEKVHIGELLALIDRVSMSNEDEDLINKGKNEAEDILRGQVKEIMNR